MLNEINILAQSDNMLGEGTYLFLSRTIRILKDLQQNNQGCAELVKKTVITEIR